MLNLIQDETHFQAPVRFNVLPTEFIDALQNSTTPDISNRHYFVASTGNTITDFKNGSAGQRITILGDGITVITNGARIATTTGANITLLANRLYSFVYFKTFILDKWVQEG